MNAPLRLPASMFRELTKIAAESKRDVSDVAKDAVRQFIASHRETALLSRSRANVRRLRAAHAEIEAEIARRRRTAG